MKRRVRKECEFPIEVGYFGSQYYITQTTRCVVGHDPALTWACASSCSTLSFVSRYGEKYAYTFKNK
jgi:hypothetical protein